MTPCRLVLGTAQLGLPYGIANKTGQPDQKMATNIVREAWKNGIREFDTAQGYGISEEVLGKALYELGISSEARIMTKFDPDLDHLNGKAMSRSLDQSLQQLGVSSLFGIILHREEMLSIWDRGLGKVLRSFVLSGKAEKIGISLYSPDKAIRALKTEGIDIVQLPTNILDRRFENEGIFELADKKKKTIYIRSIFLQGLILMNSEEIPEKMYFARQVVEEIESLSNEFGLSRQELALGYIKSEMPNTHVIFGAENPWQVRENMTTWQKEIPRSLSSKIRTIFVNVDVSILNPSLWPN